MRQKLLTVPEFISAANSLPNALLGKVRTRLCDFYCNYPEWFLSQDNLKERGSDGLWYPGDTLASGVFSRMCGPCATPPNRGPFNPENPSHQEGGRCAGIRYVRFSGYATYKAGNSGTVRSAVYTNILLASGYDYGPLTPIQPPKDFGSSSDIIARINGFNSAGSGPNEGTYNMTGTSDGGTFGSDGGWYLQGWSYSFQKFDGTPDTCGNGPPAYPEPPPSLYTFNVDISVNNNVNILIQGAPINVKVTIKPAYTQNFMPTWITIGGTQYLFDFDGLSIFRPTIEINLPDVTGDDQPHTPPTLTPTDPPPGVAPKDYPPILKYRTPEEPTPEPAPCVPETTGEFDYLQVEAETPPNYNGQKIFTDSDGDTVIFAGYVRWLAGGVPFGREEPVRRYLSLFRKPLGADGFLLSELHGANLSASFVTITENLEKVTYTCEEGESP